MSVFVPIQHCFDYSTVASFTSEDKLLEVELLDFKILTFLSFPKLLSGKFVPIYIAFTNV